MRIIITENQLKTAYQKIVDMSLDNLKEICDNATEDENWDYSDEDMDCETILDVVESVKVATAFDNEIGLIIYIDTIFDTADVGTFFWDLEKQIKETTGKENIKVKLLNVINNRERNG